MKKKRSRALDEGEKQEALKGASLLEYSDLNCRKSYYTQERQQPTMLMSVSIAKDRTWNFSGKVMNKRQASPLALRAEGRVKKKITLKGKKGFQIPWNHRPKVRITLSQGYVMLG